MKRFLVLFGILIIAGFSSGCAKRQETVIGGTGVSGENISVNNTAEREMNDEISFSDIVIDEIVSPDKKMKVYLEKDYDENVQRFIRQSIILENIKDGEKIVLKEVKMSPQEALIYYTKDGCNVDGSVCCNSRVDFNEFKPIKWVGEDKIEVNQYFDNYECAGAITFTSIYNTKGEELEKWTYNVEGKKSLSLFGEEYVPMFE